MQGGLDVVGLVPGLGEIADGANALIYLGRGDYSNAALSVAAMIPLVGTAATAGKYANKASKVVKGSKGSTKLISQFSISTIDDAVAYAMKNKVTHVFGKAAHNLDPLVTKLGGQENTFRAVLNAANGKLPASGVF